MTMCNNTTESAAHLVLFLCPEYVITRLAFAGVVSAVGLCLNLLIILLIRVHEPVLTTQNHLVLNLSGNNVVFCAYVLPVYIFDLVSALDNDWGIYCELHGFFFMFIQCNVILAYLHITLHRYFTIVFPNSTTKTYGSGRRTWTIVVGSSAFLALIMSLGLVRLWGRYGQSQSSGVCTLLADDEGGSGNYKLLGYLVAILCPLISMAYCYGHILYVLKRHQSRMSQSSNASDNRSNSSMSGPTSPRRMSVRRRLHSREAYVTVLSVSVVTIFALSYIPYLLATQVTTLQDWVVYQAVSGSLSYIHALTDPLIYVLGDSTLRRNLTLFCQEQEFQKTEQQMALNANTPSPALDIKHSKTSEL